MNSINNLKKISLLIFVLMIVPYGKLVIVNVFVIVTDLGLVFFKNGLYPQGYIFLFCCLAGIYLIYFKRKYYTILGFILTYSWLYYIIDYENLKKSLEVCISLIIYLFMTFYTSYKIFSNKK